MNRLIRLAVNRPLSCIALLMVLTGIFFMGMKNLRMEPSTEALMPKQVEEYRYNMRMKKVFGDSKLYLLSLIESREGELMTYENFKLLNEVVEEIEEFHTFDYETENDRLNTLIRLGSVGYGEDRLIQSSAAAQELSDDDIDSLLMEDSPVLTGSENEYFDVFAIDEPIPDDMYVLPIREKRKYSFDQYSPVSLGELKKQLDREGLRQLRTILRRIDLARINDVYAFNAEEYARLLDEFETAYRYKSMEAVKSFMNPISGEDIVGTEDSLTPVDFVEEDESGVRTLPESRADFKSYTARLLANPSYRNNVYTLDKDGGIRALAMNLQLQVMEDSDYIRDYFMDVFEKYNSGNLELTPVGVPVFEYYIQSFMKQDMKKFLPLVLLVVIITFLMNFRMVRGVLLPTISILLSIIWTMGLMGYLGIPLTMVVNVLPTILVAVGSSYSIHIFNQYLHDLELIRTVGKKRGLISSMSHISVTVLLASLTTFIGFSTLGFNQVVSLKHFGIFSAAGTLFTMFIASLLIPAALSLSRVPREKSEKEERPDLLQKILVRTGRFTLNKPGTVLAVSAALLLISAFGVSRLSIETAPTYSFRNDSYVVKADEKVSQALEGSIPINLMIDTGRDGGVKDPEFLKHLDELGRWAVNDNNRSEYNLLSAYTFSDIIKRMNMAMNNEDPASYTVPDDELTIEDYLMLYSGEDRDSDGLPDAMERFTDPRYRVANVFIKTGYYNGRPYSTKCLLSAIDALEEHLDSDPYFSSYRYETAGQTINYAVLNKLIARGQMTTIALTLLIISIIIFILFREIKAALVSLIPISCSIIVVFGIMGYFSIPLDITKSIIAAVTIGIGIDDTIHMLKTIRHYLLQGCSLKTAIMEAYREAGKAIVYTSLALVCGFAVLMFSSFKVLFYLGLLVALNMITTTVAALIVLPAAIWLLKIRFNTFETDEDEIVEQTQLGTKFSMEGEKA